MNQGKINLQFELINQTKYNLKKRLFLPLAKNILDKMLSQSLKDKEIHLNLFLVSAKRIKELNKKFRQKNSTTTILSFPQDEPLKNKPLSEIIVLGDIFLCPQTIRQKNKDKKAIYFFFWHGLLHLLGLNHKQMPKYQKIWKRIKKTIL